MHDDDITETAVQTRYGYFEFYGNAILITNAPAIDDGFSKEGEDVLKFSMRVLVKEYIFLTRGKSTTVFYRGPNYVSLIIPPRLQTLTSLSQKNRKYEWGKKQEEAFRTLKDNLYNAPILSLPDEVEVLVSGLKGLILAAQGEAFKDENVIAEGLMVRTTKGKERRMDAYTIWDRIGVPIVVKVKSRVLEIMEGRQLKEAHSTMAGSNGSNQESSLALKPRGHVRLKKAHGYGEFVLIFHSQKTSSKEHQQWRFATLGNPLRSYSINGCD
ncbi:hypothetical protein Tco_0632865 [Tanacetum coccineum]